MTVDFEGNFISISKTASTVINREENASTKTKTVLSSAKTEKSTRTIPMNKQNLKIIEEQKERPENKIFVFSSRVGTILTERNITRAFSVIINNAGLPKSLTIHTLRHTFATRLIEKGANPKIISDILRHSSIKVTFDVYGHVMPNQKKEVINLLD